MNAHTCAECRHFLRGKQSCTVFPKGHTRADSPACKVFSPHERATEEPATPETIRRIRMRGGKNHLSAYANREEFHIPQTPLGEAVAELRLGWGLVGNHWQPVIMELAEAGAYDRADDGEHSHTEIISGKAFGYQATL